MNHSFLSQSTCVLGLESLRYNEFSLSVVRFAQVLFCWFNSDFYLNNSLCYDKIRLSNRGKQGTGTPVRTNATANGRIHHRLG